MSRYSVEFCLSTGALESQQSRRASSNLLVESRRFSSDAKARPSCTSSFRIGHISAKGRFPARRARAFPTRKVTNSWRSCGTCLLLGSALKSLDPTRSTRGRFAFGGTISSWPPGGRSAYRAAVDGDIGALWRQLRTCSGADDRRKHTGQFALVRY